MKDNDPLVCIVDDDISAREAIAGLALSAGFRVETFTSAKEFLATPRASAPACLVLDIDLPGLNGSSFNSSCIKTRGAYRSCS